MRRVPELALLLSTMTGMATGCGEDAPEGLVIEGLAACSQGRAQDLVTLDIDELPERGVRVFVDNRTLQRVVVQGVEITIECGREGFAGDATPSCRDGSKRVAASGDGIAPDERGELTAPLLTENEVGDLYADLANVSRVVVRARLEAVALSPAGDLIESNVFQQDVVLCAGCAAAACE